MIENYLDKKKIEGRVQLEFAASGNIAIVERKLDDLTEQRLLQPVEEVNSQQLKDLVADIDAQAAALQARRENLQAVLTDVQAMEKERDTTKAGKSEKV